MGSYEQKLSSKSISSTGSTTFTVAVSEYNEIALQVSGDSNSTDIDVTSASKAAPSAPLADDDELANRTAVDLTAKTNNTDLRTYDVESLKTVEFTIGNDAASSTSLDAYIGYGEHR